MPRINPPAACTRESEAAWRAIGTPGWVLRLLGFCLRMPWLDPRLRSITRARPYPVAAEDQEFVQAQIARWLDACFVRRLDATWQRAARSVSPDFVTRANGKPRMVIDYRKVNETLEDKPFHSELLPEFIASLQ